MATPPSRLSTATAKTKNFRIAEDLLHVPSVRDTPRQTPSAPDWRTSQGNICRRSCPALGPSGRPGSNHMSLPGRPRCRPRRPGEAGSGAEIGMDQDGLDRDDGSGRRRSRSKPSTTSGSLARASAGAGGLPEADEVALRVLEVRRETHVTDGLALADRGPTRLVDRPQCVLEVLHVDDDVGRCERLLPLHHPAVDEAG